MIYLYYNVVLRSEKREMLFFCFTRKIDLLPTSGLQVCNLNPQIDKIIFGWMDVYVQLLILCKALPS